MTTDQLTGSLPRRLCGVDRKAVEFVQVRLQEGHGHRRRQVSQALPESRPLPGGTEGKKRSTQDDSSSFPLAKPSECPR